VLLDLAAQLSVSRECVLVALHNVVMPEKEL